MNKPTLKEKLRYRFDNRMSRGTGSMITMLAAVTLCIVLITAVVITLAGFNEEGGFLSTLWDNLATVINAWMPYSGDGSAGYVILTAVAAVAGLMITSVLIGIIASGIEEKITNLKKGNSRVLESGHTVILGFVPGEYELLLQLIRGAGNEKRVFVVADEMEQDEMESMIRENLEIPRNIDLICRHADISDPASLSKLSISDCRGVIINPKDDARTVKTILAVKKVIGDQEAPLIRITAAVSRDSFILPEAQKIGSKLIMLQTYDILARILAHSGTQPGLSEAFSEVLSFNGSELYLLQYPEAEGLSFKEISLRMDGAVPVGMEKKGNLQLCPSGEEILTDADRLLVFSEGKDSFTLQTEKLYTGFCFHAGSGNTDKAPDRILIIGWNEVIGTLIRELPETRMELIFTQLSEERKAFVQAIEETDSRFTAVFSDADVTSSEELKQLVSDCSHVILLSDHDKDPEEADMDSILLLLRLRDIRKETGSVFTIAAEMYSEKNCGLISGEDPTDFIIASDMASMVLSQASESPELQPVFRELLSNDGKDLFLMKAEDLLPLEKTLTVREIRGVLCERNRVLIGFVDNEPAERHIALNPALEDTLTPDTGDYLIVIGDQ